MEVIAGKFQFVNSDKDDISDVSNNIVTQVPGEIPNTVSISDRLMIELELSESIFGLRTGCFSFTEKNLAR
jgi:hypothetical protein